MNYIKHLSAFYEKMVSDDRLFPTHVSLYLALFQYWNYYHFRSPIIISRKEIIQLCKIGSLNTYHKCLHDLHNWGYIRYEPSHSQFKGSWVGMYNFDTTTDTTDEQPLRRKNETTAEQPLRHSRRKNETTGEQALRPHINDINILNNKTYRERKKTQAKNLKNENSEKKKARQGKLAGEKPEGKKSDNPLREKAPIEKRKKVVPKKEKGFVPPQLDETLAFFQTEHYLEIEARKFFFHFESTGWKVGGKSPMENWQAAAHNWMLNVPKYGTVQKPNTLKLNTFKDYSEPL
jgi:hypothetical protein